MGVGISGSGNYFKVLGTHCSATDAELHLSNCAISFLQSGALPVLNALFFSDSAVLTPRQLPDVLVPS